MEHHSNQVPWYEINADVVVLPADENNLVDPRKLSELIKKYAPTKSILGVCLGQQAIAEAFGGSLINLSEIFHGVATSAQIVKTETKIFKNLHSGMEVGRYHSWVVNRQTMPAELIVTSTSPDGQVMSFKHAQHEVRGVQFHPESVLTENGVQLMQNWLTFNPKA